MLGGAGGGILPGLGGITQSADGIIGYAQVVDDLEVAGSNGAVPELRDSGLQKGFYLFRNRNDPFQEWNGAPQTFFGIAPILRMVARWVVPAIPGMMVVPPL